MFIRAIKVAALSLAITALSVAPALAWGNGGEVDGSAGDGYGTHDWLLENAVMNAGRPRWVDLEIALLASDDPDQVKTTAESYKHVFYPAGWARGGPQQVADEYFALMQAYKAGDYKEASRRLGRLSHYYSDICQPYHTDTRGSISAGNTRHDPFERSLYDYTKDPDRSPKWSASRTRQSVPDVRAKAVDAAEYARTKYPALDAAFAKSRSVASGDAHTITGLVLNRAANDLADIIATVPSGNGVTQAPATLTRTWKNPRYRYPRSTQKIGADVVARDASGKPIEGALITFTWPLKSGPQTVQRYTDANGVAYDWKEVGAVSLMSKRSLEIKAPSAGTTTQTSLWYMRTPILADGSAGVKTKLNETRPKKNTVVKARAKFVRRDGKPAPGLKVTWTWSHKSKTYKFTSYTDKYGIARSSRNIGNSAYGYRVYVKAQTYSGGYKRYSRASFIPVK